MLITFGISVALLLVSLVGFFSIFYGHQPMKSIHKHGLEKYRTVIKPRIRYIMSAFVLIAIPSFIVTGVTGFLLVAKFIFKWFAS